MSLTDLVQARRDRTLRAKLADDDGVKRAQKKIEEETSGYGFFGRRRLLTGALRLTRSMSPDVAAALDACREQLSFTEPLEVYVKPDAELGAFLMRGPWGPLALGLTSSLVEGFTPAELRFVLGHELAHAKLDHLGLPMPLTATIEDLAGPLVSRATAIELFLWCRSAEISADRAGLVCARDVNAAASAFLKLSSGLTRVSVTSDLTSYLAQVDTLASTPVARQKPRSDDDTLECFNTHPYAPLRMRALVAYAKSDAYQRALGHGGLGTLLTLEAAEAIVERDLELMEPSYLEEKTATAELLRRVLFLAGMAVAHADGKVHEKETRALTALLGTDALWQPPALEAITRELADKLIEVKQTAARLALVQLVQHLTIVAAADGVVEPAELEAMYGIAAKLEVPLGIVDETLWASARPMD
ncbi:MAG: M48 family metalloprotease [Deltaproteobacteria bacterium]|nr:M48 family metalloprotease [Deltaproteobacteria bacterium]